MAELLEIDLSLLTGIVEGVIHDGRARGAIMVVVDTDGNTLCYDAGGSLTHIEKLGALELARRDIERRAEEM